MIHLFHDNGGVAAWESWVGLSVFYQQPHMKSPEYGVITSIQSMPVFLHVRFNLESTAKACCPRDLHWPPDFCEADRVNPVGQIFSKEIP
jgi:hypothetical protein